MERNVKAPIISAEHSLERIAERLGQDVERLEKQLKSLEHVADSGIRSDTAQVYQEMLNKRVELLAQVQGELAQRSRLAS